MSADQLMEYNQRCIQALPPAFTTIWIEDHFQFPESDALECLTTLSFLAAAFPHMRLGTLVLCQSYRNPALLAKMANNLHFLSKGRFTLGIGAGWHREEYQAYDYPFPPYNMRLDQLEEAILLIRSMMTTRPASFTGRYYHVREAYCDPQPSSPIPLLIGGGGEKRMLSLVAHYADWWNINHCQPEDYARKVTLLHDKCERIGRNPEEIRLTYSTGTLKITEQAYQSGQQTKKFTLAGTPDDIVHSLAAYRDSGVTHFMVKFPDLSTLERFMKYVLPCFV